jgi:hypothetical protein
MVRMPIDLAQAGAPGLWQGQARPATTQSRLLLGLDRLASDAWAVSLTWTADSDPVLQPESWPGPYSDCFELDS